MPASAAAAAAAAPAGRGLMGVFNFFFFTCVIYIVQDKSNDCVPNSNNEREDLGKI